MPKYDYRCGRCGYVFELSRRFAEASEPAACPVDGDEATRLFSPPLDVLVYGWERPAPARRVTIPPGALSCHEHDAPPAPGATSDDTHTHTHGHVHSHGHSHGHPH